ncbi:ABC transporter ATP-binding protein [Streptomyces sp. HNM0575]|nr:ABC transporter ATP-binding protein [Streptomyces sp. HNM0575]
MTPRAPLMEVRRLSAHAATAARPLLCDVSLTVPAGRVTAVVGPSGSGKTTLGLGALGASRPGVRLQGEVLLEGEDLLALDEPRRRALRSGTAGHLAQHPETVLDPLRRVGRALRELAALRQGAPGDRSESVRAALEAAGLPGTEMRRRLPHQLSGGEQQRVALASAVVTGARLLVLDEPTSGLDPASTSALMARLRTLADGGAGIVLLSHDLELVRELAAHVTVLERGRAVEEGPAREVLGAAERSMHPLTRGLLAAERGTVGMPGAPGTRSGDGPAAAPTPPGPGESEGVAATGVAVRRRGGGDLLTGPVTLSFPPGSTTALIGPSGSGKTTFARLLAGLTRATGGELTWDGVRLPRRVEARSPAQRRAVQYVHQSSSESFEPGKPLLGQLAATGRLLRAVTPAAAEAETRLTADLFGLDEELLHRTPGRLSGGQLQRCALVRALLARPVLLVCDEATSALDVISRERVLGALPGLLAPARTALLFISHDLEAVRRLTHRVAVFEAGRCVQQGTVADLFHTPADGAPADLVRAAKGRGRAGRSRTGSAEGNR